MIVITSIVPAEPAPAAIYTLSLHDALPIFRIEKNTDELTSQVLPNNSAICDTARVSSSMKAAPRKNIRLRSEEHTSELQSRFDLVCRLLLEKKKTTTNPNVSEQLRAAAELA